MSAIKTALPRMRAATAIEIEEVGEIPVPFNINTRTNVTICKATKKKIVGGSSAKNSSLSFASAVSFPLAYVEVDANVTLGRFSGRKTDHNFGLFDLAFTPLVASYHITQTDHVALSITVWAPTGDYDPNRLATLGLNNWTVIPGIAYTKVSPKQNIEITGIW